jgi:hypothetical protein
MSLTVPEETAVGSVQQIVQKIKKYIINAKENAMVIAVVL